MRRGLLERINAGNPVGSGPGEHKSLASPWGLRPAWVQIPPPAPKQQIYFLDLFNLLPFLLFGLKDVFSKLIM